MGNILVTMIVTFFVGLLASSIMERRAETVIASKVSNEIEAFEGRCEEWGKYYPLEY